MIIQHRIQEDLMTDKVNLLVIGEGGREFAIATGSTPTLGIPTFPGAQ